MAKVSMGTAINAPAEEVWEMVGRWNALPDWHPGVVQSELEGGGSVRRLTLVGGGTITEKLESVDDAHRSYSYSITASPLPVVNYVATIKVVRDGEKCTVEWGSVFDPSGTSEQDASRAIAEMFEAGLANLKRLFGG